MQPRYEIKHHPIDLSRFGLNPYGESIYRVVWADTRKSKVFCNGRMHVLPRYQHDDGAQGVWLLEKWCPPEVIVGMTREQYDALLTTFPGAAAEEYPDRGDWELSRVFNEDSGPFARGVDEIALFKQLAFHEWRAGRMNLQDHVQEIEAQEAAQQVEADKQFDTIYEEAREASLCNCLEHEELRKSCR